MEEQNKHGNAGSYKEYKLSFRGGIITCRDLEAWIKEYNKDRKAKREDKELKKNISDFIFNRLYERYIEPFLFLTKLLKDSNYNEQQQLEEIAKTYGVSAHVQNPIRLRLGFSIMANMCLLIETLQSFKAGRSSHKKVIKNYNEFWQDEIVKRDFNLSAQDIEKLTGEEGFYKHVRCGILHQGETKGKWRITSENSGNFYDINAIDFMTKMLGILCDYTNTLNNISFQTNRWHNCVQKLKFITNNCQVNSQQEKK